MPEPQQYSDVPSGYKVVPSAPAPPTFYDVPEGYKVLGPSSLLTPGKSATQSPLATPPVPGIAGGVPPASPTASPAQTAAAKPSWLERGLQAVDDVFTPQKSDLSVFDPLGAAVTGRKEFGESIPNAAMPAISAVNKVVQVPAQIGEAGAQAVGKRAVRAGAAFTEPTPAVGPQGITDEQKNQQEAAFRKDYPVASGILQGTGQAAGGILADPRNWPFFGAGAARPILGKLITAGFRLNLGADALSAAKTLHDHWDDLKPEERAQIATRAGIDALMVGGAGKIREHLEGTYEPLPAEPTARAEQLFRNLVYKAGGEVPANPTVEEATKAYKQAISNLHPDVNPAHAEEAQALNDAWNHLKQSGRFSTGAQPSYSDVPKDYKVLPAAEEKPVHHATNDVEDLRASAERQAPTIAKAVEGATENVPGAEVEAVRKAKDADRIEDKTERQGIQPSQVGDIAGAKVTVPDQAAADQVLKNLDQKLPVESVNGSVTGEPGKNAVRQTQAIVDTGAPAGEPVKKAEVMLQTPEMAKATEATHDNYRKAQELRAQGKEAEAQAIETEIAKQHEAAEQAARARQDSRPVESTAQASAESRGAGSGTKPAPLTGGAGRSASTLQAGEGNAGVVGGTESRGDAALVMRDVSTLAHDDKILDAVIPLLPVDVVHNLIGPEGTTEKLLHNKPMLRDALISDKPTGIGVGIRDAIMRALASLGTELSRSGTIRSNPERRGALSADDLDPASRDALTRIGNSLTHDHRVHEGEPNESVQIGSPEKIHGSTQKENAGERGKYAGMGAGQQGQEATAQGAEKAVTHPDIGLDFDGTLFEQTADGSIGKPIPERIQSAKDLLAQGKSIEIITRRVQGRPEEVKKIQDALEAAGLPRLPVTDVKSAKVLIDNEAHHAPTNQNTPLPEVAHEGISTGTAGISPRPTEGIRQPETGGGGQPVRTEAAVPPAPAAPTNAERLAQGRAPVPPKRTEVIQPTPESRAASQAAFEKNYPKGTAPEGLKGDALRAWQESIGNPLPKEVDIGSQVRAKNPEPTRAEVAAAAEKKAQTPPDVPHAELKPVQAIASERQDAIKEIIDGIDKRDWAKLPADFQSEAVQTAYDKVRPFIEKSAIGDRIKASKAQTFEELRDSLGLKKYPEPTPPPKLRPAEMDLHDFEKEHSPYEITRQEWVDMQRRYRRSLGQREDSGTKFAPNADYEEYHKESVKEALKNGIKVKPYILRDYPELTATKATPEALKTADDAGRQAGQARRRGDDSLARDITTGNSRYVSSQPEAVRKEIVEAFNKAYQAEAEKPVSTAVKAPKPRAPKAQPATEKIAEAAGKVDSLEERAEKEGAQRLTPEETVPKTGKNFEGRYLQSALEPAQEAWDKIEAKYAKHTVSWAKDTEANRRDGLRVNMHDPDGNHVAALEVRRLSGDKYQVYAPGYVKDNKYGTQVIQVLENVSDFSTAKKLAESRLRSGQVYNPDAQWHQKNGVGKELTTSQVNPASSLKPDTSKPVGFKTDKLLVKVPDDGTFVVPNHPAAIDRAIKAADNFVPEKEPASYARRVPKSPDKFNAEKYITGLEKEIATLEDDFAKALPNQKIYLQEQLKAARENLADARGKTPEQLSQGGLSGAEEAPTPAVASGLISGESGELRPGELGKAATSAAGAIGDYLRTVKSFTDKGRNLQRGLDTLGTQKQSDILDAVDVMKVMKTAGMKHADDEAIYHHLENPDESLSGNQQKWLDDIIHPIAARNTQLYQELTDGGIPIEDYVHRVVKGKGGMLDRIAQGIKSVGSKGSLSKSAPQTKQRTYMALEDEAGNRRVVSVKGGQVTAWTDGSPENLGGISRDGEGSKFTDKDGNDWTLKQATTKEIERHTETQYYHSALASTLASNIQLESAVRAMHFLEDFKSSPDFQEVAHDLDKGTAPKGWKAVTLPQFSGHAFEPRTAEVLDEYAAKLKSEGPGVLTKIGDLLRVSMLLNPIRHPLNVAASWGVEKGVTGFFPQNWKTLYTTGNRAIKAVLEKNQDFKDALDAGAALQSHRDAVREINDLFLNQLAEKLENNDSYAMQIAKALGIEKGNLLNLLHKPSSKIAWGTSDIMMIQAAYEYQAKHPGASLADSFKEVGRIIPEYRVPTRIFDSRALAKIMGERWATIFGGYRYGLLKSFGETAKSALGMQPPTPGRTKAEEVGKGWDRLAMIGLGLFVLKYGLDELAKKLTGDNHATFWRVGPFGMVQAAEDVFKHKQSVSQAAQRIVTPAPVIKSGAELLENREFYTGRQIYDPHADFNTQRQQIGKYLLEQAGQVGQFERAQGETEEQRKRFWESQAGVTFQKSAAERLASDIAIEKGSHQAETPADERNRVQRRDILNELRKGNRKPFQEAQARHQIDHRQALNILQRSRFTPLQDLVHGFTYADAKRVYDAGTPEEKKELDIILAQKARRHQMEHWQAATQ